MPRACVPLAVALIAAGAAAASAADWPRFRGPNGTGAGPDTGFPVKFSATENLLWKAAIPGSGASSPIVSAGKVFVQSASPDGRERFLICLDAKDGKEAWRRAIPGGAAKTHKKNTLASSTPAADGRSVYAVFWDGESITVHAFDFAGKPLWNRSLGGFKSQHGAGESPVVHGGKVFVNHDQDGAARLVALDAATGAVAWEQTRKAYRACYSTPFLHKRADGTEELIVASTAGIAGHDPAGGRQNWVWNWDWSAGGRPLRTVGSPVAAEGLIFLSSGDGAGDRAMVAVKADGATGDVSGTAKVWENRKSFPYVPSMLASGASPPATSPRPASSSGPSAWAATSAPRPSSRRAGSTPPPRRATCSSSRRPASTSCWPATASASRCSRPPPPPTVGCTSAAPSICSASAASERGRGSRQARRQGLTTAGPHPPPRILLQPGARDFR